MGQGYTQHGESPPRCPPQTGLSFVFRPPETAAPMGHLITCLPAQPGGAPGTPLTPYRPYQEQLCDLEQGPTPPGQPLWYLHSQ